ncbi:PAS domain-containing protein [Nocardioides sp. KIGAM211]|uniref:histidine kinase n=1 Tax=Nocardioides luti TaxID=2761101 RepID=A0A7X0RG94_9ACTN|nr:PAS domain-containing protein [Nocardioides luti]
MSGPDHFRAAFTQFTVGALVLTPVADGLEVVDANQAAAELLGVDLPSLLGQPSGHASKQEDLARILAAVDRLLAGSLDRWEAELELHDTPVRWVRLVLTALPPDGVRPLLLAQLSELDRARSDFVSSVSHELRTPLTTVLGYTEVLLSGAAGPLTDQQTGMLLRIEQNGDRLLALLEDLLTLSRIEAGSFRIERREVDLVATVARAVRTTSPLLDGRRLGLTVSTDRIAVKVPGDAEQLERVVVNLLSNAVKFTPDGGQISVSVEGDDHGGTVHVTDTGMGVPAEDHEQLFTRFFRSSTAYDRAIPGTGLGLSIVKSIVDGHGGAVSVRSAPARGSRFSVRLPAR